MKKFLSVVAIIMAIIALNSCSKDGHGPDYAKMRVSRMDIAGAKAVGFIDSSTGSRAEAVSSGLYKIDANGNISAVAVYFTEDEDGNQTKHESEVRMVFADMANVGNDYIYFSSCRFSDKNGELINGLPYKILVRKTDGKMWNLDEEHTGVNFLTIVENEYGLKPWQFYQDYNGTLYYADRSGSRTENIYKFNLKTEPATIEQVTANREIGSPYSVDSNGVICGPVNAVREYDYHYHNGEFINGDIYFVWQNSGFQDLNSIKLPPIIIDYSNEMEGLECEASIEEGIVTIFRGQYYLIRSLYESCTLNGEYIYTPDYIFLDKAVCNKFSIGNTPGSAAIDEDDMTTLKNDLRKSNPYHIISVMPTPEYILISGYFSTGGQPIYWITALNPEKKEWKWVCEAPYKIDFTRSLSYNDRYWIITEQDGDLGAFWFHPGSLESGFVKFATTLPSYMDSSEYEVVDGNVIFSGVNPADSHNVRIVIDLMTGEAVTNDEAPEFLFSTLISLN